MHTFGIPPQPDTPASSKLITSPKVSGSSFGNVLMVAVRYSRPLAASIEPEVSHPALSSLRSTHCGVPCQGGRQILGEPPQLVVPVASNARTSPAPVDSRVNSVPRSTSGLGVAPAAVHNGRHFFGVPPQFVEPVAS